MTTTRPAYTGPRTRFTKPDGTYLVGAALPIKGRTYLFDMENGPCNEVAKALGLEDLKGTRGSVGGLKGTPGSFFYVEVEFTAGSDEEAKAYAGRLITEIPDLAEAHLS